MTTDDAPRPALDAAALEELVYEFGRAEWRLGWNARSVNYSPADQADRDAKCAALVQAIRDDVTGTTLAAGRQLLERSHLSVGGRAALANWLIRHVDALLAAASERDALAREATRLRAALPSPCPEHGIDHMGLTRRWGWLRPDVESASVWACHHEGVPGESDCGFWHPITPAGYAALASQEGDGDGR